MQTGILKNAGSLLATSAILAPIGLVTSIVVTRGLSVEDRGLYALAATILTTAVVLSQLGWPSAVIYRLRRSGSSPETVGGTTLMVALGMSTLVVAAGLLLQRPILAWLLPGAQASVLYLALASLPALLTGLFMSGVARGLDRFGWQNLYRVGLSLGRLGIFSIVLLAAGGALRAVLGASLLVNLTGAILLTTAVLRFSGRRPRVDRAELRATARIGAPAWIHTVAGNLHERVDLFMLAALLHQPETVAIYAIAAGLADFLKGVPEALAQATLPELAARAPERAGPLASDSLRHALLFLGPTLALAAATGPWLIPLVYGQAYSDSATPFLILLPGIGFHAVYRMLARYFFAIDRQRVSIGIQLAAMALNVTLNALWIPGFGVAGAAAASLVTYTLEGIAMIVAFCRFSGLTARQALAPRISDLDVYRRAIRGILALLRRSG